MDDKTAKDRRPKQLPFLFGYPGIAHGRWCDTLSEELIRNLRRCWSVGGHSCIRVSSQHFFNGTQFTFEISAIWAEFEKEVCSHLARVAQVHLFRRWRFSIAAIQPTNATVLYNQQFLWMATRAKLLQLRGDKGV